MNHQRVPFLALLVATFATSFNELAVRIGILILVESSDREMSTSGLLFLALVVFPALPAILLSPFLGLLSDRVGRPAVLRVTTFVEFILVIAGAYFLSQGRLEGLLYIAFLLGLTASAFMPVKYAAIIELTGELTLSRANGQIICVKYLAYFLGLLFVGATIFFGGNLALLVGSLTSASAAVGFAATLLITIPRPHEEPGRHPWHQVKESWTSIVRNRELFLVMMSFAYFLTIGVLFQLGTSVFFPRAAHISEGWPAALLGALCGGIALGALFAGRVSLSKVEVGLVPIGAIGVAVTLFACAFVRESYILLFLSYLACGLFGGAAVVPLNSLFQLRSPESRRGSFLGISHAFSQAIVLSVSLVIAVLASFIGLNPGLLFVLAALSTVVVSAVALKSAPIALIRCVNWIFTHTIYRIRVFGAENVPPKGGALLICNHISYLDPLLVSAVLERGVRFLISRPLFARPLLHAVLEMIQAIPISTKDKPTELMASIRKAREALLEGRLVCLFAEGEPSRVGHMLRFSRGLEHILRGIDVPIVPLYLDQTWGSLFEGRSGRGKFKLPKQLPYPASLTFGKPMPGSSSVFDVRQAIAELGTTAFSSRDRESQLLQLGFLKEAKAHPFRTIIVESDGRRFSYLKALIGAFLLARATRALLKPSEKTLGIWLPPGIGAALTNLAILFNGLIPVNLNYTVGKAALASSLRQAEIQHVVTSRRFTQRIPEPEGVQCIYLEDLLGHITKRDRAVTFLKAILLPKWILQRLITKPEASHEDVATIVFSSGSTGVPKGVLLSHGNISSNVESMYNALDFTPSDGLVGVLPFFHSFGLTTCLWLPLISGARVLYHVSPLDAEIIGNMISREKASIMLGTPTFLLSYIRRIPREHLTTIRWTIVGAEKLRKGVAAAYLEKFGKIPFEGYGCTELSPVAMINVPDIKDTMGEQIGNKPGTVGHPIPGVAVKVVNPESKEPVGPGEMGVLLVKGPNVMKGYLNAPEKTADVIWEGWYVTGDLASIDEDGFVTIHDRISRFSKIAGEMVPHLGLEDAIQKVLGEIEPMCVVAGVPDPKRGERLVVLYTKDINPKEVVKQLSGCGLSSLWLPRAEDFFRIQEIPLLGSGKLDLHTVKQLAAEKTGLA